MALNDISKHYDPDRLLAIAKKGPGWLKKRINHLESLELAGDEMLNSELGMQLRAYQVILEDIGGWDDRKDLFEFPDGHPALAHAKRVGALVMEKKGNDHVSEAWGIAKKYCPDVRFHHQPFLKEVIGTAFLLDAVTLITAWHVVRSKVWTMIRFIPDFSMIGELTPATAIHPIPLAGEPKRLENSDWAVLKLKPEHAIGTTSLLEFSENSSTVETGYMIGHPLGLPLKIADNGVRVRVGADEILLELDAYACNSGSPVVDKQSHKLIGMFVGAPDGLEVRDEIKTNDQCVVFSPRFPVGESIPCRVLRIETLLAAL